MQELLSFPGGGWVRLCSSGACLYLWLSANADDGNGYCLCCRAGLAYFNPQEGHIIHYGLVWRPHLCIHIPKRGGEAEINIWPLFTNNNLR